MATTAKLKTQACPGCNGVGSVPADDVGMVLRSEREKAGVTGKDIADAMSISDTYLYELERGTRRWTNELVESYQRALGGLSNG